jgi:hypothetical protein
MHLNEHSDWWYRLVHGDKDTFHLAWRKIGQAYAMPNAAPLALESTILQHDFAGDRLFQHRNFAKWTLEENPRIAGFQLEKECRRFLSTLRKRLMPDPPNGIGRWSARQADPALRAFARSLCSQRWNYARIGLDARPLRFLPDGTVGEGHAGCERWWNLRCTINSQGRPGPPCLEVFGDHGLTFHARRAGSTGWRGAWIIFERTSVVLKPLPATSGKTRP